MFESILVSSAELSVARVLIHIGVALIAGAIISLSYIISNKGRKYSSNFAVTLVILPIIVSVVITLIGSDIAKAVSLGGVFALVRFRSVPGDSKDIAYVFFTMVTGLAVGVECFAVAFILALVVSFFFVILTRLGYANSQKENKILKITIPENLDYQGVFDDIFDEYLIKHIISNVKTTNMGTLFQITYDIVEKDNINEKEFIDKLRARNGNLNILIGREAQGELPPL